MDDPSKVVFGSGAVSTKQPRLDLLWYRAFCRIAERTELGIGRHGVKAINARSSQDALKDREFVINRASHIALHALHLIAILEGTEADDGEDHAAAIGWGGMFLCAVDLDAMMKENFTKEKK